MSAPIEETYAEAFRSLFAEVVVTARDETWLNHACMQATGHASSTIMCDCEAGVASYLSAADTPDGRPGTVLQFHVPRFRKDREEALYKSLLARISQNVLTCPTAAAFSPMAADIAEGRSIPLGRKIAFFGDGYEFEDRRHDRDVWVIPIMGG
ncbi:MAG: formylmethanofuran--tetrahydromethanopterin N-formyltransferase, partial [Planctomycetota bacterium]